MLSEVLALDPALFEQEYASIIMKLTIIKGTITSLMNYLDDIAIGQSEQLGVGVDYLKQRNVAWVLYKWDIKIHKYLYMVKVLR